jgi:hypothetical protein
MQLEVEFALVSPYRAIPLGIPSDDDDETRQSYSRSMQKRVAKLSYDTRKTLSSSIVTDIGPADDTVY